MINIESFRPTHQILNLIAEIDEFKGAWTALGNLAPERLLQLKKVATIESVASSTRIEGSLLTDQQVERLSCLRQFKKIYHRETGFGGSGKGFI